MFKEITIEDFNKKGYFFLSQGTVNTGKGEPEIIFREWGKYRGRLIVSRVFNRDNLVLIYTKAEKEYDLTANDILFKGYVKDLDELDHLVDIVKI